MPWASLFLIHKAYWWFIGYGAEVLVYLLFTLGSSKRGSPDPRKAESERAKWNGIIKPDAGGAT